MLVQRIHVSGIRARSRKSAKMLSILDLLGVHFGDIFDKMRAKGCSKSLFENASKKSAKRVTRDMLRKRPSDPSAPIRTISRSKDSKDSRVSGFPYSDIGSSTHIVPGGTVADIYIYIYIYI